MAPFATLDAKLLSALTNIITGDFARKVDTFKEAEANEGRIVRGRQVLFMLHDHFSTNMKHGSTYALQDLFSVHLKGENLKTFISNWDQVLAGIVKVPEESVLETLFYNQVKNCKAIAHDLNEYHRADEGTEKRKYDFLVSAVRRHLDRERLETNRERVARNLSGTAKPSAPAVEGKVGFIPTGYCVKWNKGGCTNENFTFKHEVPSKRTPSTKPKRDSSRGRSPSRTQSPKGKGKKKECIFWKRGRCERGDKCNFSHNGPAGKPRQATPARSNSSGKKGGKKTSRSPGRKSSRSPGKPKSPRNSRSPKGNKNSSSSGKATPAAVCLVASMLASVASGFAVDPAKVCCPSIGIRFSNEVDVHRIAARGNMWPIVNGEPKNRTTYPWGDKFEVDQQAVSDCALSATMLSGAVENSLKGIPAKCSYECDTEFGCDYCIPKGIVAAPAESREMIEGSIDLQIDWIADTGSAQDLVSQGEFPDDYGYYSSNPIRMMTANGESSSMKQGKVFVPRLGKTDTLKYEVSRMGTPGGVDHKVLKSSPGMIVELYPL